jgi:hypothetical protein
MQAILVPKMNFIVCLIPSIHNIRHCSFINSILTFFPLEIAYQQIILTFHYHTYILNIYINSTSYDIVIVLTS